MAKSIIMSKVTKEELEKLQTQQNEITSLEAFIGKLELAKLENVLKLQQLKNEQGEYHTEIEGKYGKINIDLADGSYTPIE